MDFHLAPSIFDIFELCISGQALRIFLRSSLAHTMKAFIGRLMCGLPASSRLGWRTSLAFSDSSGGDWAHDDAEIEKVLISLVERLRQQRCGYYKKQKIMICVPYYNIIGVS